MAKAPWEKYVTASKKNGWVLKPPVVASKARKSPRQKMLDAIDKQLAAYKAGEFGKGSWFRPHADGDVVKGQVRYGTQPLKLMGDTAYMEMSSSKVEDFFADIRAWVESGKLDDRLEQLSRDFAAAKAAKA
ncbi:hypothetical protein [Sphingobium yanoikuyae]|jgi:hypothetical protein|uniref:hypothetical protein n=1 Tax=Sphingobium yanoikuyae TaxID=13690 RepID=UPI00241DC089|nr:hypothetical protein [Sphingobium yanoikuyae]